MSTVQNIIDGALGWSTLNDQDVLASDTELINLIDLLQKRYMSRGAALNPAYFAEKSTVTAPGSGNPWQAPADASIVFRVEKSDGSKVHVVPVDDRDAEYAPAIYHVGQAYYAVTATNPNPTSDSLIFYLSLIHI